MFYLSFVWFFLWFLEDFIFFSFVIFMNIWDVGFLMVVVLFLVFGMECLSIGLVFIL